MPISLKRLFNPSVLKKKLESSAMPCFAASISLNAGSTENTHLAKRASLYAVLSESVYSSQRGVSMASPSPCVMSYTAES